MPPERLLLLRVSAEALRVSRAAGIRPRYKADAVAYCLERLYVKGRLKGRDAEPELIEAAQQIVANQAKYGEIVERAREGDPLALEEILTLAAETTHDELKSHRRTTRERTSSVNDDGLNQYDPFVDNIHKSADDYAQDAAMRIMEILVSTPSPGRATSGAEGVAGDYVFFSPFDRWVRAIARNTVRADYSSAARRRAAQARRDYHMHLLESMRRDLATLLDAMLDLAPVQRGVMAATLSGTHLEPEARRILREVAPDALIPDEQPTEFLNDRAIATFLGLPGASAVSSARGAARAKLHAIGERHGHRWHELLELLMPHGSPRFSPHTLSDRRHAAQGRTHGTSPRRKAR